MTRRILHVGDVHLQSGHPRNADRLASLDQIVAHAESTSNLSATVIPGDLFHQKPTTQDRNDLADRLVRLAHWAPVVLAYGNHDEAGSLDIFGRLETRWPIYVVDQPRVVVFDTPGRSVPVACFVLPWPYKAGLTAAGVAPSDVGAEARSLLDPIFLTAAADLQHATEALGALPLMIAHATIGGARSSTGQPQIGMNGIELDPLLLARLGSIYKGFSHIHAHQEIYGAVYAGSICRLDFAEVEPKGLVEVEYQRDGDRWEHRWRFVPLEVPAMHHVEGELTRDGFRVESINGLTAGQVAPELWRDPDAWKGADVRCRYRYVKAEIGALDVAQIHAEFAGCRSLKLDPVPVLAHEVRAPEIAAAPTLEAKVQAYCERHGITWTPALAAKLTDLQRLDGAALLTSVVASLAAAAPQRDAEGAAQEVA